MAVVLFFVFCGWVVRVLRYYLLSDVGLVMRSHGLCMLSKWSMVEHPCCCTSLPPHASRCAYVMCLSYLLS